MGMRIMRVRPELFLEMFHAGIRGPYRIDEDPVPEDARVKDVCVGADVIEILIESDEFDGPQKGDVPSSLIPVARNVDVKGSVSHLASLLSKIGPAVLRLDSVIDDQLSDLTKRLETFNIEWSKFKEGL